MSTIRRVPRILRPLIGAIALTATAAPLVQAQDFYRNKTITLIVGNPAGSGYDAYARLLARHMPKHLAGTPNMVVQNMPGAGSVKATDYTYNIAPGDGTAFALAMPGTLIEPLIAANPGSYRYDPTKIAYIGTMDSGTRVCVTSANAKTRSLPEARSGKTIMAATAPGSSAYYYPKFMNALAGTKIDIVGGYQGPADLFIAMERGEADGACGLDVSTFKVLRPDWLAQKKVNFITQFGLEPSPALTTLGMPSIWEYITDPEDRKVVELIVSQQVFQRPFLAPPATPPERVRQLRAAFMSAVADPELIAEAAKQNLDLNPKSGEDVEALVQKIYTSPKDLVARMAKLIQP